jgi:PAS domain S-box-containing protein
MKKKEFLVKDYNALDELDKLKKELENTQNALRLNENKFKFLADNIPQIIWESKTDGTPIYYNEAWYLFTGMNPDKDFHSDFIHIDDIPAIREAWKISLTDKRPFELELRLKRSDGIFKWFLSRSVPFFDENGEIVKWLGSSTDIEDKKRSEQRLKFLSDASEILLSTGDYIEILKNISRISVPVFADWCSVYLAETDEINLKAISLIHKDPEKLKLAEYYLEQFPIRLNKPGGIQSVFKTGKSLFIPEVSEKMLDQGRHDASHLEMVKNFGLKSMIIIPLIYREKIIGVINFVSSESYRSYKQEDLIIAEELVKRIMLAYENSVLYRQTSESAEQLRLITDAMPALISYVDQEERYIFNNKTYEDWLGIPRDEIAGKRIRDLSDEKAYSFLSPYIKSALDGNDVMFETKFPYKAGEKFVRVNYIPHKRDGNVNGFFVLVEDLSGQKKTEEMLARQKEALIASNSELEQFAYIASHDLQEPLRMVGSYVQLLAKRYKKLFDKDGEEFIGYAIDGAMRMKKMLEGLLDYSRVGRKVKNFSEVDLNKVLDKVTFRLEQKIRENNAKVEFGSLPVIQGDDIFIFELFRSLVDNALKFRGKKNPQIIISYERKDNELIFSVKDNGIGINKAYFHKIFTIFQTLHSRSIYPGIGLGLSLSKRIIEYHGGRIWVESEEDKGSTFSFTLPA